MSDPYPLSREVYLRLWAKVRYGDNCWEWTAGTNDSGYGIFTINRRAYKAHRIAYAAYHGAIPDGLHVLHSCDNPPCCNPDHLRAGTRQENMQDAIDRGRTKKGRHYSHETHFAPGERHPNARLTAEKVRAMRRQHRGGAGPNSLAEQYGVSVWTVYSVLSRKNWAHVSDETGAWDGK